MREILSKLISLIVTVLVISVLTFTAFSVIPGNAALNKLGVDATPEQIAALEEEYGLNKSLPERYFDWLSGALHGDFGMSYEYDGTTVSSLLSSRLKVSLLLAGLSFAMIIVLSFPLALLSVRLKDSWVSEVFLIVNQVIMAIPSFFLGILVTFVFGLWLRLFQPGAFISPEENLTGAIRYLIFPALTVALPKIAMTVTFLRTSVLSEEKQEYVKTARSKGASERRILYVHVLRNALIPVITFLAMIVAEILAGSIVAEQVFSVPGLGRLLISSISSRDYPVVQAIVCYITVVVVGLNFLVDVLYRVIDPRVRKAGVRA